MGRLFDRFDSSVLHDPKSFLRSLEMSAFSVSLVNVRPDERLYPAVIFR